MLKVTKHKCAMPRGEKRRKAMRWLFLEMIKVGLPFKTMMDGFNLSETQFIWNLVEACRLGEIDLYGVPVPENTLASGSSDLRELLFGGCPPLCAVMHEQSITISVMKDFPNGKIKA